MLNKQQKKELVKNLTEELKAAKGVVFSEFDGLPTRDIQELRASLRREQVKHKVVKLTLLKRALELAGVDISAFNYTKALAVSWSADDEVVPAKILNAFARTHANLKIMAGVAGRKFIDALEVKTLANLPGKQELRGQLVYVVASPLRGLVDVLSGNMRGLVNALNAIKNAKA